MTMDWLEHISVILPDNFFQVHLIPDFHSTHIQYALFLKGFMLQFVNVKIYMFGVTALTGYVVGYMFSFPALLFFELVIATIGTIATCTWTGLGVLIQKFYLRHFRVINIILALTLLECIWGMLR